ncbi:MAG: hypothetical protein PHF86_03005 [Candidatus Nanoarchaeia archaeon]|jgi:hypothetical protein|nr:hypothetical protein [Candidatus Nanoarchaeia archaeon]
MQTLYEEFFKTCKKFDKLVQEQRWKIVKNRNEFKNTIENEYEFWVRVLKMLPPERRLLKEFSWMQQCYNQIMCNLVDESVNWKIRWLSDNE